MNNVNIFKKQTFVKAYLHQRMKISLEDMSKVLKATGDIAFVPLFKKKNNHTILIGQ